MRILIFCYGTSSKKTRRNKPIACSFTHHASIPHVLPPLRPCSYRFVNKGHEVHKYTAYAVDLDRRSHQVAGLDLLMIRPRSAPPRSSDLSATNQRYSSLVANQPPVTSQQYPGTEAARGAEGAPAPLLPAQ
jgi:hypothetical protein